MLCDRIMVWAMSCDVMEQKLDQSLEDESGSSAFMVRGEGRSCTQGFLASRILVHNHTKSAVCWTCFLLHADVMYSLRSARVKNKGRCLLSWSHKYFIAEKLHHSAYIWVRRSESLCHPKCWICFSFLVSEYMWGNHLLSVAILIAVNNNTPSRWKLLLQKEILRAAKGKESHQQAQGSSYQWNLQKGWKSKAYWLVAMGVLALSAAIALFLRTTCGDKAWI